MIISGGSRCNYRFFGRHLVNAQENERVEVTEMRGLTADSVPEALREMDAIASGTARCKNGFYHANINTRADELLTPEQWEQAVDRLEHNLHLDGHARFVVEHTKDGRTHRHVVWSRIDPDTMTAVSDTRNFYAHEQTSRELEELFGHEPVASTLIRDTDVRRPDRRPENWETFRGKRSGIDPEALKQEVTALWNASDSGTAFAAALEAEGYILCRGDRRDFVIIDEAGDDHALGKRINGARAAAVRARMADIDRDALPSVAEGRELAKAHWQAAEDVRRAEEAKARRDQEALDQGALDGTHEREADQAQEPTNEPVDVADAVPADPENTSRGARELLDDYVDSVLDGIAEDELAPVWTPEDLQTGGAPREAGSGSPRDRLNAYSEPMEDALRQGQEIPAHDGLSWFARFELMVSQAVDTVVEWGRQKWDSFVAMVQDRRNDHRDPYDGREQPEPEPDFER